MGASSGIGASLAKYYAEQGAFVYISGRRKSLLEALCKKYPQMHYCCCDATNYKDVEKKVHKVLELFGRIDVWINCVGQNKAIGKLWELHPQDIWEEISVDLRSCIHGCHGVLPTMIEQNSGVILNFCGGGTDKPHLYAAAYSTAKTGIARFTEALALELKQDNIPVKVFCTNPGLVKNQRTLLLTTEEQSKNYMPEIAEAFTNGKDCSPILTAEIVSYALEGKLDDLQGALILPFDLDKFLEKVKHSTDPDYSYLRRKI